MNHRRKIAATLPGDRACMAEASPCSGGRRRPTSRLENTVPVDESGVPPETCNPLARQSYQVQVGPEGQLALRGRAGPHRHDPGWPGADCGRRGHRGSPARQAGAAGNYTRAFLPCGHLEAASVGPTGKPAPASPGALAQEAALSASHGHGFWRGAVLPDDPG